MKKVGILLIVLVVLAGTAGYFVLRPGVTPSETGFADYLPSDTLAVFSLRDLSGLTDIFPGTALGQFLSKETMGRMLEELQVDPQKVQKYNHSHDQLFSVLQNPAFRMVFGDDVDLAILSLDGEALAKDRQLTLKESLVVLATTSSSKALETFARNLLHGKVGSYQQDDLDMTRIQLDEGSFLYAYVEGERLLLAESPKAVVRCVSSKSEKKNLQQNPSFLAARNHWQGEGMEHVYGRFFVQLDRLRDTLLAVNDPELNRGVRYLQGMHGFFMTAGQDKETWRMASNVAYSYEALDPSMQELVDSAAEENFSLHLLQDQPLIYSWSSSFGPQSILQTLSAADKEQYDRVEHRLQSEFGVSLDQVLQAFGSQYGFALKNIVESGLFPLPKLVFFIQIKDHAVTEALLTKVRQRISARGMGGEQQEQVGPYTLYSWALLPGEATQPAIILTEDMLYLANGPSTIKHLLDYTQERTVVPQSTSEKLGPELSEQVQSANNGVFVFWPNRFADQVKGAADWLEGMLSSSRSGSVTVIKDELFKLIRATETAVFISDIFLDHGQSVITLRSKAEKPAREE